jgi:hypothetical protein
MKPAVLISILLFWSTSICAEEKPLGLERLDFLIGTWRGTSTGEPGEGTGQRECARILNGRFLECTSTATYPPQKANAKGEVHADRAIFSYDKRTKKLRLRQFHGEGFINTYAEGQSLVFETSEIENIPEGWRARETYKQLTPDSWQETFELAAPGKEFTVYSTSTLERVK